MPEKSKKEYAPMDTKRLQDELLNQAERLSELAARMSDQGRPLDAAEKRECRIGLAGWLAEMQSEAEGFFIAGLPKMYDENSGYVFRVLEFLT